MQKYAKNYAKKFTLYMSIRNVSFSRAIHCSKFVDSKFEVLCVVWTLHILLTL